MEELKMKWIKDIVDWCKELCGLRKLREEDFKKKGFKKASTKGTELTFYKGNTMLKWDKHPKKKLLIIRWQKSLRYYGVIETPKELKKVLERVFDYKLLM